MQEAIPACSRCRRHDTGPPGCAAASCRGQQSTDSSHAETRFRGTHPRAIAQILLGRGLLAAGVAIDPVAPNAMIDFDWGFLKNSAVIANPLMGDEPIRMDAKTFHASFANTLSEEEAARAFEATATHDSRNVLRDCMGPDGRVDLDAPHAPLLLIGGEEDEIIPAHLTEKNFKAYTDPGSVTEFRPFPGRSHYICNEPGWEEVAAHALAFLERHALEARDAAGVA